jgi:hypothetical protein
MQKGNWQTSTLNILLEGDALNDFANFQERRNEAIYGEYGSIK